MKTSSHDNMDSHGAIPSHIMESAAHWVLRLDRGLTAIEQDDYSQWLASDPQHRETLALQRWGWDELDRLTGLQTSLNAIPDPNVLAPPQGHWSKITHLIADQTPRKWLPMLLATAAALTVGLVWFGLRGEVNNTGREAHTHQSPRSTNELLALIKQRTLSDGSTVELNRGAVIETLFTDNERRVRLVRGEANFIVAKNPVRPFIVSAGGVEVRAVGTVFNVKMNSEDVEVLVSEGKVAVAQVTPDIGATTQRIELNPLAAGQASIVPRAPVQDIPPVATLSQEEIAHKIAWLPRMLDFTDEPLAHIVEEFNRRNPLQLVLEDPKLASLRLSATFRSDNLEGFVRLMESDFGMQADQVSETRIALRRASNR